MRAFALRDWWHEKGGQCEVYHPLEKTFWGYRAGCALYNIIQKNLPLLHYAYFHLLEHGSIHRASSKIIGAKKFIQKVGCFVPDITVSTHAHLNHGYFELTRLSQNKKTAFAVYCGELAGGSGFSRHWINPQNNLFISPFREGVRAAQARGMPPEKTLIGGPLLRKPFYSNGRFFDKLKLCKSLGLDINVPIFLLGTGANGVNNHIRIIKAIIKAKLKCQVLALCGKNKKTYESVQNLALRSPHRILPFELIDAGCMVDLLKVATWILARPGAGLTTEAIVTGCPVVFDLRGGSMPQEVNNLNFWKARAGAILTSSSSSELIEIIRSEVKVPSLNIPLESSPDFLLNALYQLGAD